MGCWRLRLSSLVAERGEGVRYVSLTTAGINCSSLIRPEEKKGS